MRGRADAGGLLRGLRSRVSCPSIVRARSTPSPLRKASLTSTSKPLDPRWLSDVKQRIGKCMTFGLNSKQLDEASSISQQLAQDWRELAVGGEGYLTGPGRVGLDKQAVVWGEMSLTKHFLLGHNGMPAAMDQLAPPEAHIYQGHVNNVQYLRYAESGRCNWMRSFGIYFDPANKQLWTEMASSRGIGLILKSIKVDYKFPMTWPDRISVFHKLRSRPDAATESIILDVMILSETKQRPAARCLEDVVVYDYPASKKTTLPGFLLDQFQQTFDLQEAAKAENGKKINRLLDRVRDLELESWDRPDAQEDFGTSRS